MREECELCGEWSESVEGGLCEQCFEDAPMGVWFSGTRRHDDTKVIYTNAPEAYDYPWTRYYADAMRPMGRIKFKVRVVELPADRWQAQRDRYLSGCYAVFDV